MSTLDLDQPCVLCHNDIPYLNEFIENHLPNLSKKISEDALYNLMYEHLEENGKFLNSQDCKVPKITIQMLKHHYEHHEIKDVLILKNDILTILNMQKRLSKEQQTPSVVNAYLQGSCQSRKSSNKFTKRT